MIKYGSICLAATFYGWLLGVLIILRMYKS